MCPHQGLKSPNIAFTAMSVRTAATFPGVVFPQEISAPVQYGPRVQNIAVYLQSHQLLPEDRAAEAMKDLFGLGMSAATLATTNGRIAEKLTPKIEQIERVVTAAKIKHLDETGFRVGGKLSWLHVTSTEFLTHYRAEEKTWRNA